MLQCSPLRSAEAMTRTSLCPVNLLAGPLGCDLVDFVVMRSHRSLASDFHDSVGATFANAGLPTHPRGMVGQGREAGDAVVLPL